MHVCRVRWRPSGVIIGLRTGLGMEEAVVDGGAMGGREEMEVLGLRFGTNDDRCASA